ncbi:hypothetical protein ABDE16_08935 [Streptomyces sp. BRB040]|uniref:hypothetical protein n=1 Tax=Streptomyces sp. BRB040 TaxID=3142634 RepID=UPI0031F6DA4D
MTTAAPAVEHTDRGPLVTDERAARIARDIPDGVRVLETYGISPAALRERRNVELTG